MSGVPDQTAEEVRESLRTRLVELVKRALLLAAVIVVALGALGAIIALATDRKVSTTIAVLYYLVGCVLFLIGMFPSGGFSMTRGTVTRRRPLGSRVEPMALVGVILVALGVLADVTRPF
jgi:amino acid transporter